jgi:hypothetical protein
MELDRSKAVGAYAGVVTLGLAWLALAGVAAPPQRFGTIDVQRINVRENDGTLRLVIAGRDHIGGIRIADKEYPHPNRTEAGMIFYNDEGTENGGLVFDGRLKDGRPTNSGQLSFDRWHQDQTLYVQSLEDGPRRRAGLFVQDRVDKPMDFAAIERIRAMPEGPARAAATTAAGLDKGMQRAFLGRDYDNASKLVLRDGKGRPRLQLSVDDAGEASIAFLDESGRVVRSQSARD